MVYAKFRYFYISTFKYTMQKNPKERCLKEKDIIFTEKFYSINIVYIIYAYIFQSAPAS